MKNKIISILIGCALAIPLCIATEEHHKSIRQEVAEIPTIEYVKSEIIVEAAPMKPILVEEVTETECKEYADSELDESIQDMVFEICDQYGFDASIVIALIERESECNVNAMGDAGKSYGLCQVQKKWHIDRMARLGITDLLDAESNILCAVDYLSELDGLNRGIEWTLMAYNGGLNYANKMKDAEKVSEYATEIIKRAAEIREKGNE